MSAAVPITAQNTEPAQSVALEVWSIVDPDGIDIGIWPSQRRSVSQNSGRPSGITCKLSTTIATSLASVSFMRDENTTVVPAVVPMTRFRPPLPRIRPA